MKVGVVSDSGELLGCALRIANANHEVTFQCKDKQVGVGLVSTGKVDSHRLDYIIVGNSEFRSTDTLRKAGYPVFGGGRLATALQKESFTSLMLNSLNLQSGLLPEAIDLFVGGLFNGEEFTYMFSFIPYKHFMDGGRGKSVESMGCILWPHFRPNNLIVEVLFPFKPLLSKFDFHGMFTLGVCLTEFDVSVFKASVDTRSDVLNCIGEILKMDMGKALFNIAKGESNIVQTSNFYAICVNVTVPPFPEEGEVCWYPVEFVPEAMRHLWPAKMYYNDEKSAYYGAQHALSVTAQDNFIRRARKRVYRTISNISLDDVGYRIDIGKGAILKILQLDEWGWI